MKTQKISLLALAVLAGGITAASAATQEVNRSYQLFFNTPTNINRIWEMNGIATPVSGFPKVSQSVNVSTETSGKIIGSGFVRLDFNTNNAPYSGYAVDVTGRARTQGNKASFQMRARGPGGLVNGNGTAEPGSVDLNFTGEPAVNPLNTNNLAIVGKLSGNIRGVNPLSSNNRTARFSNVVAADQNTTSFNPMSGTTIGVLQTTKRMQFFSREYTGSGSIRNNNYRGTLRGIGFSKGSSFNFNGNLGPYTNNIGTNAIPFVAPVTADVSGRTHGQSYAGSATRVFNEIGAFLVY